MSAQSTSNGNDWASLAAAMISAASTGVKDKRSYKYTKKLQDAQNAFVMQMSNTAHQREVADLRKAGLNPILSATGGNGASTPSAGTASFEAQDPGNTALQSLIAWKTQQANQNYQENQMVNDTKRLENETDLNGYNKRQIAKQMELLQKQIEAQEITNKYLPSQLLAIIDNTIKQGNAVEYNAITNRMQADTGREGNAIISIKTLMKEHPYLIPSLLFGAGVGKYGPGIVSTGKGVLDVLRNILSHSAKIGF